jgi:hypothetical protein
MPEVNEAAAMHIATSYQAHVRAMNANQFTEVCNCTVSILFSAFYIEESLNFIIEKLGKSKALDEFCGNNQSGLFKKIVWFYDNYVTKSKHLKFGDLYSKKDEKRGEENKKELEIRFPGINRINDFRDGVAHGIINKAINCDEEDYLRQCAKNIVSELIEIANRENGQITRTTTYLEAIYAFEKNYPSE